MNIDKMPMFENTNLSVNSPTQASQMSFWNQIKILTKTSLSNAIFEVYHTVTVNVYIENICTFLENVPIPLC